MICACRTTLSANDNEKFAGLHNFLVNKAELHELTSRRNLLSALIRDNFPEDS